MKERGYGGIDKFRMLAAVLVVAIHTSPLAMVNETTDFVLTRVIARVAVPFFFMVSGFFVFKEEREVRRKVMQFTLKTSIIYGVAVLFYLPLNLYRGYFQIEGIAGRMLKDILVNGTIYHLWYLPAAVLGVLVTYWLINYLSLRKALGIALFFYVVGLFGDSYYGLIKELPVLKEVYNAIFTVSDFTRNGLFYAPAFLVLGAMAARQKKATEQRYRLLGLGISFGFMLMEGLILHQFKLQLHDSMYIALVPCMYFLFQVLISFRAPGRRDYRTISLIIYLVHPMVIVFVRGIAKYLGIQDKLLEHRMLFFLLVMGWSAVIAYGVIFGHKFIRIKVVNRKTGRAWIEINMANLKHNAKLLQQLMPQKCEMMAVVKANAYGHGDYKVAHCLNKIGVKAYAVATMDEGIALRKKGIRGEILVLGYSDIQRVEQLKYYRLIQTVIDYEYAKKLADVNSSIKVHIKVDTGMHRLGIRAEEEERIAEVFTLKGLEVCGIFTHLCVADSMKEEDKAFTQEQIDRFYALLGRLSDLGITIPKVHIQSSYGLLNYPELQCDYARIGIALYGSLSALGDQTKLQPKLRPVLALKARIALIREIKEGEGASYGRDFLVERNTKIAVIPIGYADGLPRSLSGGNGSVLLHGHRIPMIGRICMDQLLVDITDAGEVHQGDIVTIIGNDGTDVIHAEEVAKNADSITNELLSRLGYRIERIYV